MNTGQTVLPMKSKTLPNAPFLEEVRRQLKAGHTVTFRVRGYSMRPFLENGRDKVQLEPPGQVKVGDVALVLADDGRYVLHRIVAVEADGGCLLWGDGNVQGREHCSADNVIGIASGFWRKERFQPCSGRLWSTYSWWWMRLAFMRKWLLLCYRAGYRLHLWGH